MPNAKKWHLCQKMAFGIWHFQILKKKWHLAFSDLRNENAKKWHLAFSDLRNENAPPSDGNVQHLLRERTHSQVGTPPDMMYFFFSVQVLFQRTFSVYIRDGKLL